MTELYRQQRASEATVYTGAGRHEGGRFCVEQILEGLKEAEGGAKVTDLCRLHGISDATFYTWRSEYGSWRLGGAPACGSRGKSAVQGHRGTRKALDLRALKDVLTKNGYGPR